ncbi:17685_t:CDS:2 [Entrophospora sp. SA101]|nr:10118_t:CDS:2 [Entrophospora sp. SA101]CAJ0896648.1 17685_t:CDS:2 [Entrophospora sp. SA101]
MRRTTTASSSSTTKPATNTRTTSTQKTSTSSSTTNIATTTKNSRSTSSPSKTTTTTKSSTLLSPTTKNSRPSRSPSPSSRTSTTTTASASRAKASVPSSASSIKEHIAQARIRKANVKAEQAVENELGPKSLGVVVKQAKSSGRLNISHCSLKEIPEEVWKMYEVDPKSITLDFSSSSSDVWYETVNLLKLIVADNQLEKIDKRIIEFDALVFLDVKLSELKSLATLNLSTNKFTELPNCIYELSSLVELMISSNQLTGTLDKSFGNLKKLEIEASENQLEIIFLGLNENQTITLPSLIRLDARQNKLKSIVHESKDSTIFNPSIKLPKLKELLLSFNQMDSLGLLLHSTIELEILDIANNKFNDIPEGLLSLKNLKRLDIRNNQLRILAPELGTLISLDVLLWDGNPLRNIPKGQKSTAALLKSLRAKLSTFGPTIPENRSNTSKSSSSSILGTIPQQQINSRSLDLAKKNLNELPESDLEDLGFEPSTVILSFNSFTSIPIGFFKLFKMNLKHLHLDNNKFTTFPIFEDKTLELPNLETLDLSANQLTSLPDDSQHTAFPNLKIFNVNKNRITELPKKLPFPQLTTFLATSNKLGSISPSTFENMEVVDISNNNIGFLPPELGNLITIKTLIVEGNSFRVPRYTIVQQGTSAIMEYLRGRIPKP